VTLALSVIYKPATPRCRANWSPCNPITRSFSQSYSSSSSFSTSLEASKSTQLVPSFVSVRATHGGWHHQISAVSLIKGSKTDNEDDHENGSALILPGSICNQSGPKDRYKMSSLPISKVHLVKLEFGNAIFFRHRIRSSLGPRRFGTGSGDLVDRTA